MLSDDDWKHWITRGYVIVRQAVPPENVKRLVDLLWEFQEMNPTPIPPPGTRISSAIMP